MHSHFAVSDDSQSGESKGTERSEGRTGITGAIQRPLRFKENTPLSDTSLFSCSGASEKIERQLLL